MRVWRYEIGHRITGGEVEMLVYQREADTVPAGWFPTKADAAAHGAEQLRQLAARATYAADRLVHNLRTREFKK